ncbi:MAG: hypothetical protein U0800_22150 [Isosphaeraceae bacterium]
MTEPAISIRRAGTPEEYRACQEAQREAWGIVEDGYIVPVATLVAAQLHGGLVLGAFLPDGTAVGMNFAFLGRLEGRICLYSQLLGIVPGYQDRGLGGRIKEVQREIARSEGIPHIAWAYDPLQAGNARFNLDKLGATGVRFVPNMYGLRTDALNAGMPSDRLIVEWPTTEAPPRPIMRFDEVLKLPAWIDAAGGDAVGSANRPLGPITTIEIPADLARLRKDDPESLLRWRMIVREAFVSAFHAGYRAIGFRRGEMEGRSRCFYLLEIRGIAPSD